MLGIAKNNPIPSVEANPLGSQKGDQKESKTGEVKLIEMGTA